MFGYTKWKIPPLPRSYSQPERLMNIWERTPHRQSFLFSCNCCCFLVAQSCPTPGDPRDWSPPGPSVHGIPQARILEWVAISFSRGFSWPRDWTRVFCTCRHILPGWAAREAPMQFISTIYNISPSTLKRTITSEEIYNKYTNHKCLHNRTKQDRSISLWFSILKKLTPFWLS